MNNYEDYDDFHHEQVLPSPPDEPLLTEAPPLQTDVDFDDPIVAALPRVLLMGPRRGGKTSIQVGLLCGRTVGNIIYFFRTRIDGKYLKFSKPFRFVFSLFAAGV